MWLFGLVIGTISRSPKSTETGAIMIDNATLWAAAVAARLRAHAPFSQFLVGAALETVDGEIVTGCNVENASYGLTICAERVAVFKAISEGQTKYRRICIVADTKTPIPPCGACRQILWEFGGNLEVVLGNLTGITAKHTMGELLPLAFDAGILNERG